MNTGARARWHARAHAWRAGSRGNRDGFRCRIHALIVDDDLTQAQVLGDLLLQEAALHCTIVTSAEHSLAAIKVIRPDMAILDLVMPDMDGIELLHRLRAQLPALPTLLVTGPARRPSTDGA